MSYYRHHVFVCENRRDNGEPCCGMAATGVANTVKQMRMQLKEQGEHGRGRVRVNRAGCFDRCNEGPVLVVYPEEVWYRYQSAADLHDIVREHLLQGKEVERLRLKK